MRDPMPDEMSSGLLGADDYERCAEMGAGKSKTGATIRVAVIAACLLAAGGAIALNAGKSDQIAITPQEQRFAATNPQQVEPQQLTPVPAPTPELQERVAAVTPKAPPRPAVAAPQAKPSPAARTTPPAAIVIPPPATTIPEIAPAPSEIAPDAAAPIQ